MKELIELAIKLYLIEKIVGFILVFVLFIFIAICGVIYLLTHKDRFKS